METYWTQSTKPTFFADIWAFSYQHDNFTLPNANQWKSSFPTMKPCVKAFPIHTTGREFTTTVVLNCFQATMQMRNSVWLLSVQFHLSPALPHPLPKTQACEHRNTWIILPVWVFPWPVLISQGIHVPNHKQNSRFRFTRPLDITWDSQTLKGKMWWTLWSCSPSQSWKGRWASMR